MKLRIKGNTIRLRLLRSEVEEFAENGEVTEQIRFGVGDGATLSYTLVRRSNGGEIKAGFEANGIRVELPADVASGWTNTEEVGIEADVENEGVGLHILIEKDFACVTREDDPDKDDAYPNPSANC